MFDGHSLANWCVDKVEEICFWLAAVQVCCLTRVHHWSASHRHIDVKLVLHAEVDCFAQAEGTGMQQINPSEYYMAWSKSSILPLIMKERIIKPSIFFIIAIFGAPECHYVKLHDKQKETIPCSVKIKMPNAQSILSSLQFKYVFPDYMFLKSFSQLTVLFFMVLTHDTQNRVQLKPRGEWCRLQIGKKLLVTAV